jgi:hypothetical protein
MIRGTLYHRATARSTVRFGSPFRDVPVCVCQYRQHGVSFLFVGPANPKSRRECLTIEAVNPDDGKHYNVMVSYDRIRFLGRLSQGHTKECAELVPMTLQRPTSIFEGLLRDEDDDKQGLGWRCYCGVPDRSYGPDGEKWPPWPNQVFLVFLNRDRMAYNWRWEKADPRDSNVPAENVPLRFKRRRL